MKYTICSVGDAIHTSDMPSDYNIKPIKNIVESADIRLFNLEYVLSESPAYGSTYCGGTWLAAKTDSLDDLLEYGFNGCSFANNHTMDYSYDGMFSTLEAVRSRNLPVSGAGKDLIEASDYAVIDAPNGKCALISICSTFNDAARAGNPSDTVPGRPGLNPLRFSTVYEITEEHMKALKEMSAGTKIDGRRNRSRAGGYTPMPPDGCFGFGEYNFRISEVEGKTSKANARDVERTTDSIKKALIECDYVVVNVHSHEIKGDTDDTPDDFMAEFSRKCIDAGASAVIGTGTHQLKPIEIYKGKPIFYSIGNFIFQSDEVFCMPEDFREKYKLDKGLSPTQMVAARAALGNGGLHADAANFRSLIPYITYDESKVTDIKCYMLKLNEDNGMPYLADFDEQKIIFDYMCERCKPYGTEIVLNDGYIEVKVK